MPIFDEPEMRSESVTLFCHKRHASYHEELDSQNVESQHGTELKLDVSRDKELTPVL